MCVARCKSRARLRPDSSEAHEATEEQSVNESLPDEQEDIETALRKACAAHADGRPGKVICQPCAVCYVLELIQTKCSIISLTFLTDDKYD